MSVRRLLQGLVCVGGLVLAATAGAVAITRDFTASWYNPATNGQGFSIEVIDSPAGKLMVVYWYTFDADGKQIWVVASGPVRGDTATLSAFTSDGGRFGNLFDPSRVNTRAWGGLSVSFSDCNTGAVQYTPLDPRLPPGTMPITRLSSLFNSRCTAGASDDARDTGDTDLTSLMTPGAGLAGAVGQARFQETLGYTEFSTEVQDLPPGTYQVYVGGEKRGAIAVGTEATGTRGKLQLRSPPVSGAPSLEFDPRGQHVALVRDNGEEVMAVDFPADETPPQPVPGAPAFGNAFYQVDLISPTGGDGYGDFTLDVESDHVALHGYLSDMPLGRYELRIAGKVRTLVDVAQLGDHHYGEFDFRNPPEDGKDVLDFDPRGQLIEALRPDGTVIVSGTLSTIPVPNSAMLHGPR